MKIQIIAISALALLSISPSFAVEQDASKETKDVISALISHDGAAKIAEFSKYVDTVTSVTINEMEDSTDYKISGIKLLGGDVVCGHGSMVIHETYAPGFGFSELKVPVYRAEVSGQSCQ